MLTWVVRYFSVVMHVFPSNVSIQNAEHNHLVLFEWLKAWIYCVGSPGHWLQGLGQIQSTHGSLGA